MQKTDTPAHLAKVVKNATFDEMLAAIKTGARAYHKDNPHGWRVYYFDNSHWWKNPFTGDIRAFPFSDTDKSRTDWIIEHAKD
jgi:hypothetical protein